MWNLGGEAFPKLKNNAPQQDLGLNKRQLDALQFFREKREVTSSEYAHKYKVTDRTARADLTELVKKDLLGKRGETKSAVY